MAAAGRRMGMSYRRASVLNNRARPFSEAAYGCRQVLASWGPKRLERGSNQYDAEVDG